MNEVLIQLLLNYYCTRIEASVLRGEGGGGILKFFCTTGIFLEKCSWGPETPPPPHPPLVVELGRKTIHFFL